MEQHSDQRFTDTRNKEVETTLIQHKTKTQTSPLFIILLTEVEGEKGIHILKPSSKKDRDGDRVGIMHNYRS